MMKFIKWRSMIITCAICLFPILLGIVLWDDLPEIMAIHFNIKNQPDGFASKEFVVFGLPVIMMFLQAFCCVINDINEKKHGERKKFERATKWIVPVLTVVLQIITLGYGLGWKLDIRKIVAFSVGMIFVIIGNYLPKLDYIKNWEIDTEKARKINRMIGFETVVMGVLFLISIFLPPIATIICLLLMIPYAIAGVWYGIREGRK